MPSIDTLKASEKYIDCNLLLRLVITRFRGAYKIVKKFYYDSVSKNYDTSRAASAEIVNKLINLLKVNSDSVLLDMGCGTGNYTAALQQLAKLIIGVDLSLGMIKKARTKLPSPNFICGNISSLPFNSEKFDGAYSTQVIHHVQKKDIFIREAHRVLRRGAYIAIETCSHSQILTYWFCHYFPKSFELEKKRIPAIETIIAMLESAGFSNIGIEICFQNVIANETLEKYLDKNYRDGISTFALLSEEEIEIGCNKLREDIASGAIESVIQKYHAKKAIDGGSSIIYGQKI